MKNKSIRAGQLLVTIFLIVAVVLPLCSLLLQIRFNDIVAVFQSPQFLSMIHHSLLTTTIATLLSVSIAFALAWCLHRCQVRYKNTFVLLFTIPMLIPSISHGQGLVILFGDNGLITNALGVNIHLFGYVGIILGSLLYSFPAAFLMLYDVFRYEDYTIYESAEVLGLNRLQQFRIITMTNLKRTLISAFFATFTIIFTDYGVPLMVGGKTITLPVYMYREVIGLMDFSKGAVIGTLLLLPAVVAFIVDLCNHQHTSNSTVIKPFQVKKNKKRDAVAYVFFTMMLIFIALPIFAFLLLSFVEQYPNDLHLSLKTIQTAMALGIQGYLLNSLAIACASALCGVCLTYLCAYITTRCKKSWNIYVLHLISMLSLAIPGIVLGLSYVLFFQGSILYGSIAILVMVNITHFFASPYLLAYHSLSNFNENLEDISMTLGVSSWRMLLDVYIPCTKDTILEMFAYLFVNAMVTISAVSFLTNFHNMPIALMIPQFDAQSFIEGTAFISILILLVNLCLKSIIYFVKKYL